MHFQIPFLLDFIRKETDVHLKKTVFPRFSKCVKNGLIEPRKCWSNVVTVDLGFVSVRASVGKKWRIVSNE